MPFTDLDEHLAEIFGQQVVDTSTGFLRHSSTDREKRTADGYAMKRFKKNLARRKARAAAKLCACGCGKPLVLPKRRRGGTPKRYLGECAQRINSEQKRKSRARQRMTAA